MNDYLQCKLCILQRNLEKRLKGQNKGDLTSEKEEENLKTIKIRENASVDFSLLSKVLLEDAILPLFFSSFKKN